MAKFSNVSMDIDENGKRIVRYDREDKDGNVETIEQPYFLENGEENPDIKNILLQAAKQKVVEKEQEKVSEYNEEAPKLETTKETDVDYNKGWFSRNKAKLAKYIVIGAMGLGVAMALKNCGSDKAVQPAVATEATTEDYSGVEGAVEYISYEEAVQDMGEIGKKWEELGYDEVSQRSLNSLYFATNYDMFEEETIAEMTEKAVVSSDPMVIIADSLEALSVCQDQGGKAVTGQDKEIIDMSMFCVREEDKQLVTYAYNELNKSIDIKDNEDGQRIFYNYYHYLRNEETTEFPVLYNEADKGVNYLMNQAYGPIYAVLGGQYCANQEDLMFIEREGPMNGFGSVIKEMENCLDVTKAVEETKSK